jgi:hypothetical protein
VDTVPDPLILRKSDSTRDRAWDLRVCSQELCQLDHRVDLYIYIYIYIYIIVSDDVAS